MLLMRMYSFVGELMVTGAHGKGISVCEMLVLDEKKDTMRRCLQFFKERVGLNVTETFVIDKDFNEWRVIEEVYPNATVSIHDVQC